MNDRIRTSATTASVALLGATLLLGLTACANIEHALKKQHEETSATYVDAQEGWVGVDIPAWIPDDATDLHSIATINEQVAVVRVSSTAALPTTCTIEDRHGIPSLPADWSTDSWPDTVSLCGEYEVIPVEDGWLGWFNAAEEGDAPS